MLFKNVWIKCLKSKEGGKSLHFYQLRFQITILIFTNAKIKSNEISMLIFVWNIFIFWNRSLRSFLKIRFDNNVDNCFTGVEHFFCKTFGNKNWCFCYTKRNVFRMFTFEIDQKFLVLFFSKIFIEFCSDFRDHVLEW